MLSFDRAGNERPLPAPDHRTAGYIPAYSLKEWQTQWEPQTRSPYSQTTKEERKPQPTSFQYLQHNFYGRPDSGKDSAKPNSGYGCFVFVFRTSHRNKKSTRLRRTNAAAQQRHYLLSSAETTAYPTTAASQQPTRQPSRYPHTGISL